jgi:predicted MFS family arabinose efflux permease
LETGTGTVGGGEPPAPTSPSSGLTDARRRVLFSYVCAVYFLSGAAETYISPLFPLLRHDLGLRVADQAVITAVLALSIGTGNLLGGWLGSRRGDRVAIRVAAALVAVGSLLSGAAPGLAVMLVGQVLTGLGVGLFFGPGLAVVGRMYVASRGRAIASYGLAYSLGLAAAAFAANVGADLWRAVFLLTAVVSAALAVATPQLAEALDRQRQSLLSDAVGYLRFPMYRTALAVGVASGTTHYLVIGLTPQHFVDRGTSLGLVAGLVGIGRLASMGGKYASGWLFDILGGPRTAQLLITAVVALGIAETLLPGRVGLWAVAPFVCLTAMMFPVSNAMVVVAVPDRATWGAGIYRATLMLASGLCAVVAAGALHVLGTTPVMVGALAVPVIAGLLVQRWFVAA